MSLDEHLGDLVRGAVADAFETERLRREDRFALTNEEAQAALGVSERQIRSWLDDGHLTRLPGTSKVLIPIVSIRRLCGEVDVPIPINAEARRVAARRAS